VRPAQDLAEREKSVKKAIHREGESGQILVLTALVLAALMGFVALGVDVGLLLWDQRELQTAADAAAISGAIEYATCGATAACSAMQKAAQQAATENGYTVPTSSIGTQCPTTLPTGAVVMIVNNGPCSLGASDPNNGKSNYVEVVLTEKQSTFLAAVLGPKTVTLLARAEAEENGTGIITGSPGNACFYMNGLTLNGSSNLNLQCGIQDNGSIGADSDASVTTSSFTYAGGIAYNNCGTSGQSVWTGGNCTFSNAAPEAGSSVSDPLSSLTVPTKPGNSSTASDTTPSNGATMQPGYYPNGFNLNSNTSVTLAPGVYYMNASIVVDSGSTLTGAGVTLYFASGTLQLNGASTLQLSAPTSSTNGSNGGMVLWEAPGNSSGMTIDATTASYFQGAIYFPNSNANLTLNSASGVTINGSAAYTIVDIGGSVIVDSNNVFKVGDNYATLPSGFPIGSGSGSTSSTAVLAE
jgi:Flp pilus assembly protein TadG